MTMTSKNQQASTSFEAVLWDMDGTLIDSEPLWQQATAELSEYLGRRLSRKKLAITQGATVSFTINVCAEHAGVQLDANSYAHLQQQLFDRMKYLLADVTIVPGISELLNKLRAEGTACYVVTNTFRDLAQPAIDAIGRELFAGSICGDEVEHGKPDPMIYATAAKNLNVNPAQCLAFEDSEAGMTAAVAAGCKTIAVPHTVSQYPPGVLPLPSPSFVGVEPATMRQWFSTMEE